MVFEPRGTVFVILSFEGPDVYSQAGGLGVRVKGLARTLAQLGYQTYLYFCGDPDLPGEESHESGRLVYRRWCQWISARHRAGVYDGEEEKIRDWNSSLPPSLIDNVIAPAVASGRNVVVMGEEWHTSWSMNLLSESLYYRGLRDRVVILWNANNTFGFHRINWPSLALAATITTVSRYMKFKVWERAINPIVIPNGIPRASIQDAEPGAVADLKAAAAADHFCFKIGRFDPDKRWLMAVSAAGYIKRHGKRVRLLMRGGREPHGGEVITELNLIQQRPRLAASIRRRGRVTARAYTWEKVIEQLLLRIEFAAAQQAVTVPNGAIDDATPLPRRATRKRRAPLG